ncbi:hypothetical protein LOC51_16940 [Rubrivivax sp. JA1024]|nr:hypothetical protein [Rubrivivax sp. JA1024]
MKTTWRTLSRLQAHSSLLPELRGRVFHITSVANFLEIIRTGSILHNQSGELKSNGSYNAYFKNRGCVSFCDLNTNVRPRKVREAALSKYNIFGQGDGERSVFLFLAPASYGKLIPWTAWKKDKAWSEMVVPHLESGYPGFVPLEEVEEALLLHIPIGERERTSYAALLNALRTSRSRTSRDAA